MIVDANVFKGFYEATLGRPHALHGCPIKLLASATPENPIHQDTGQMIESEWRKLVDPEWFNSWLADQFTSGNITLTDTIIDNGLEKNLYTKGFPKSKDIWYVRLGLGVVSRTQSKCQLFSEDIDFYDPSMKNCTSKKRTKTLTTGSGPIAKILKKQQIHPCCLTP